MPVLRGHHLICLHFFNGEGYDQTFINNLCAILNAVKSGGLKIGAGGDDVCRNCPYLKNDCCEYAENADAEIREMDRKALELLDLSAGNSVPWDDITNTIPGIFPEWYKLYCEDCAWLTVCGKNDFFRTVRPANS
jgi:hypothetical protein